MTTAGIFVKIANPKNVPESKVNSEVLLSRSFFEPSS